MVQFIKYSPDLSKTVKLTARAVFAILNEKIMALFDNDEDSDSVIKTISLNQISPPVIPTEWAS